MAELFHFCPKLNPKSQALLWTSHVPPYVSKARKVHMNCDFESWGGIFEFFKLCRKDNMHSMIYFYLNFLRYVIKIIIFTLWFTFIACYCVWMEKHATIESHGIIVRMYIQTTKNACKVTIAKATISVRCFKWNAI